jgi:hypothetical protein
LPNEIWFVTFDLQGPIPVVMMESNKSTLERAFELARSGTIRDFGELRLKVSREGYTANQLDGYALHKQLRGLIREALAGARS